MFLLCAAVVAASCLLSSDKKEQNTSYSDTASDVNYELDWFEALKLSNAIPSTDTYQLPL